MRTVDEYMKLPYRMEIVPDTEEGGYVVSFPDLPGCLTIGDTIEDAIANAEDAKRAWIEVALESKVTISEPDDLENYSGTPGVRHGENSVNKRSIYSQLKPTIIRGTPRKDQHAQAASG